MKKAKLDIHTKGYVIHPLVCELGSTDVEYLVNIAKTESRYIFNGKRMIRSVNNV